MKNLILFLLLMQAGLCAENKSILSVPINILQELWNFVLNLLGLGELECELSMCDCKCHPKGQTIEQKQGVLCGINCLRESGVSGCRVENETCVEIIESRTEVLNQEICESVGGHWDSCGSACRGAPNQQACIEICVSYCECGGPEEWTCPKSYACTDYVNGIGICQPV